MRRTILQPLSYFILRYLVKYYVLRYLVKYLVAYLNKRREQRYRLKAAGLAGPTEIASTVSSPGVALVEGPPPPQTSLSPATMVWYILSGVLLGSAIELMLAKLLSEEN